MSCSLAKLAHHKAAPLALQMGKLSLREADEHAQAHTASEGHSDRLALELILAQARPHRLWEASTSNGLRSRGVWGVPGHRGMGRSVEPFKNRGLVLCRRRHTMSGK